MTMTQSIDSRVLMDHINNDSTATMLSKIIFMMEGICHDPETEKEIYTIISQFKDQLSKFFTPSERVIFNGHKERYLVKREEIQKDLIGKSQRDTKEKTIVHRSL